MKKAMKGIIAALILLAWTCPSLAGGDRELALAIYKSFKAGQALPLASKEMPGLTLAHAYGVQAALLAIFRSHMDHVAGFKAELTSKAVFSGGLGQVAFEVK